MEQAFGDVDERAVITNNNGNGFANALYILNHMSQFGEKGPLRAAMAKTTTGRDLLTNLTVYTRDCTTKAIYLGPKWGGKTYEQIITQPIEKAFEFESKIYFTEVRNAGQTLELSCTDAWKTITEQMNGKAFDEIDTYSVQDLANKAGFCTRKADGSSSCDVETPDELMNKFQRTSLNALSDSSVKAQKYMLTSVGRNILNLGLAQGYATYKDTTSAAMLAQAIEQRNVQWAAEQSMFLNSVRPMMAFMESFFYALTPFAAVFVMLGLFGLGLFFKYILLLIWVQMWLPVMAIANMYIMSAAKREMNSIISGFAGQNFEAAKNIINVIGAKYVSIECGDNITEDELWAYEEGKLTGSAKEKIDHYWDGTLEGDTVTVSDTDEININGSTGNDKMVLSGLGSNSNIYISDADDGNDYIEISNIGFADIAGGNGDDEYVIDWRTVGVATIRNSNDPWPEPDHWADVETGIKQENDTLVLKNVKFDEVKFGWVAGYFEYHNQTVTEVLRIEDKNNSKHYVDIVFWDENNMGSVKFDDVILTGADINNMLNSSLTMSVANTGISEACNAMTSFSDASLAGTENMISTM